MVGLSICNAAVFFFLFFFTLPSQSVGFHPPQSPVVAAVTGAQMEKQKVRRKKLLFPFCL